MNVLKKIKQMSAFAVVLLLMVTISMPTHAENLNKSFLEVVSNVPEYEFSEVDLRLQNIEIKANKNWSGEVALIYEKSINEDMVSEGVQLKHLKNQKQLIKTLSKDYGNIIQKLNSALVPIEVTMDGRNVEKAIQMIEDYMVVLNNQPLATIDMELQQANEMFAALAEGLKMDFRTYDPELRDDVVKLERIKNIDFQKIIDELNAYKNEYVGQVTKEIETSGKKQLETALEGITLSYTNLTIKRVRTNEKEMFVILEFKNIKDLHDGFMVTKASDLSKLDQEGLDVYNTILNQYMVDQHEESEVLATYDYLEDIVNKTQKIMTITLETQGLKVVQTHNSQLQELLKENSDSPEAIYGPKLIAEIKALEEDLINYKNQENEIQDDSEQVDKVLKIINEWYEDVENYKDEQLTDDEIIDQFNSNEMIYLKLEHSMPYEIRLSVEGNYLIKNLANGQVDPGNNYFYGIQNSGPNAMRLLSGSNSYMSFYEPKTVSMKSLQLGGLVYLALLGILFFVKRSWFLNLLIVNVLLLITFIVIYPLAWVVGASLNGSQSLGSVGISPFPSKITFIQYERLFLTTDYGKWFMNSFKIAVANMLITVTLAVSAAYVFSRFKFKGKKIGLMTMLIIQIFPSFSAMVAIYTLLANVKFLSFLTGETSLVNTHLGLILVYCAGQIPYNTWLVKGYFDTLPRSMDEAAKIDGASNMQAFLKVILPLGRPIIAFVAVTSFMAPWMDFILPRLLLKSTEKKTLAVGLFEMINGRSNNSFTMFAAGAVLVAIPITLMYAYFQKYIVKGLASGAVKG